MGRYALLAVIVWSLPGCLHDSLEKCGPLVCPETAVCVGGYQCVPRDSIAACEAQADGTPCTTFQLPDGVCGGGVCIARGCGNGVVESGEACDDSDTSIAGNCASDCGGFITCPPLGGTPVFSREVHQEILQPCTDYTSDEARSRATAMCPLGVGGALTISQSIGGGPFELVPSLVPPGGATYSSPRLSPEGDVLWFLVLPSSSTTYQVARSRRSADGTWSAPQIVPTGTVSVVGRPSRGPNRRIFINDALGGLREMEEDVTGALQEVFHYTAQELGVAFVYRSAELSADGLHINMTASATNGSFVYYADRPSIGDRFGVMRQLLSFSLLDQLFLTDNCDRLYVGAVGSIVYFRQVAQAAP